MSEPAFVQSAEALCGACGHLTSDHETTAEWTVQQQLEHGSPCNRCNADPFKAAREFNGYLCTGFREWPMQQIPHPGTWIAIALGCECPVMVNVRRAKERMQPVYADGCGLHAWVCKLTTICSHEVGDLNFQGETYSRSNDHSKPHFSCEHCTIPHIECSSCGNVWTDWRITPQIAGWLKIHDESPNLKSVWRCSTCRQ